MPNPSCLNCCNKHLSYAYGYGNEVLSGNSAGGNPDHRIDFSSEMLQAERHADVISHELALKIRHIRKVLQGQRWKPTQFDLGAIRTIWYFTYALNEEDYKKIKEEDSELATQISIAVIRYERLQIDGETSDVSKNCKCGAVEKKFEQRQDYGNKVYVLYSGNNKEIIESIKNLFGEIFVATVDKSFEKWPTGFIEKYEKHFEEIEGGVVCLWPGNIKMLKKTSVFALPSIYDQNDGFSKNDEKFLKSVGIEVPKKFVKTPIFTSISILKKICDDYYEKIGLKEIDDIYSVLRNLSGEPKFDNSNNIVSNGEISQRTLFLIK